MNDICNFFRVLFRKDISRRNVFSAWRRFYTHWSGSELIGDYDIRKELPVVEHSCDGSVTLDICNRQFKYYYHGDLIAVTKKLSNIELYGMLVSHDEKYFATMLAAAISSVEDYMED